MRVGFSFWLQGPQRRFSRISRSKSAKSFSPRREERPELAGVFSQFSANTPQLFADVDRDKVLKQGVAVADVYQTLQAYLGGRT